MRVLLIADYSKDALQSMQHFVIMMENGLNAEHQVTVLRPPIFFGHISTPSLFINKWLGYLDKYLIFPWILMFASKQADVIHFCDQSNAPYVWFVSKKPHLVTCHDVLAIQSALGMHSQHPTGFTGRIYQHFIHHGLAKAQLVACVSEFTRSELHELGLVDAKNIITIENGFNYQYAPMPENEAWLRLSKYGLTRGLSFLLHVGGNIWYKNRSGVIELFALIRKNYKGPLNLVMAGKPLTHELRSLVATLDIAPHLYELSDINNEELCALYSVAKALIFPSFHEGFGWPIIEAQVCGCPVFTSDREPLRSIGGKAARYFDPTQLEHAATVVCAGLEDRECLREKGFVNACRFSTDTMIKKYIEAYQTLCDYRDNTNKRTH